APRRRHRARGLGGGHALEAEINDMLGFGTRDLGLGSGIADVAAWITGNRSEGGGKTLRAPSSKSAATSSSFAGFARVAVSSTSSPGMAVCWCLSKSGAIGQHVRHTFRVGHVEKT